MLSTLEVPWWGAESTSSWLAAVKIPVDWELDQSTWEVLKK